jgi:hypothetical protein
MREAAKLQLIYALLLCLKSTRILHPALPIIKAENKAVDKVKV